MFRIRRIFDDTLPLDAHQIGEVQRMLREHFRGEPSAKIKEIPEKLRNPFKDGLRYTLFVAERNRREVEGCALMSYDPSLNFCFLDYIAAASGRMGRGIGGSLYERVREEALALNVAGLFFESQPDEAGLCSDARLLKENIARMRFYERYGARPIGNTDYASPWKPEIKHDLPFLMLDTLGREHTIKRTRARQIVKVILEKKYGDVCPARYIRDVVASIKDDPIKLRPPRYNQKAEPLAPNRELPDDRRLPVVFSDQHVQHHVTERGYVESPARVGKIRQQLEKEDFIRIVPARSFPESYILAVHDREFVYYLKRVCETIPPGRSVYPYVFPVRNPKRRPDDLPIQAGYYCIDTFTPLNQQAYLAARRAVDCALTAADEILRGSRMAYALVRPPGHHSEHENFGGFCYFNNTAIAADYLSAEGKVAILDLDYHHGNGQQDIFYRRRDVLTISIHGHPRFAYPYFSGFREERGEGQGLGFNINFPLPEHVNGEQYRQTLRSALRRISAFKPRFLVVPLGLDTAKGDPTGTWSLTAKDFERNGRMVAELNLPMLFVQEGGYKIRTLGHNAAAFFHGVWKQVFSADPKHERRAAQRR